MLETLDNLIKPIAMTIKKYVLFIVLSFLYFSCQDKVEKHSKSSEEITPTVVEYKDDPITFKEELYSLPIKNIPVSDSISTNEAIMPIDPINIFTFKLDEIFKNWFNKEYNYQLISGYRLNLSKDFYTAVLKIKIGDIYQEHRLINYNLEGRVINSTRVAVFSDGELEYTTSKSKISQTEITLTNQFVVKDSNYKEEVTTIIKIEPNGNLIELTNDKLIIDLVAKELNVENAKRIQHLEVLKLQPNNKNEAIIVIPEIVEEGEEYFSLNTNIVIYNKELQKVTHKYFESHQTNGWVSDAIRLDQIEIDTAPYLVNEYKRAFGVRVHYFGSSRVNPYYNKTLSLYVKESDKLRCILHNYNVEINTGEWNGDCEGEFHSEKKTLIGSDDKTNDFYNFIVKNTITKTTNFETEIGDCDYNEEIKRATSVLKFDGKQYK